ncbi:MAG: M3 family metallopeptidase [Gammaproteobacteria bacterium]|nr:M3 family metallopeptidase [Gammaproteobacteria bacterium]
MLQSDDSSSVQPSPNPFFEADALPYGMPAFDRITDEHFRPAMERGMAEQLREIAAIVGSNEPPTFANTIIALERSGGLLNRVNRVFGNLNSVDTNPERRTIQREMSPRLAAHRDTILLDSRLFGRIEALYEQRESLDLDPESLRLLERYHLDFVRAGARLTESKQQRLREINAELADLSTSFSQNVLDEVNDSALIFHHENELRGLDAGSIRAAAAEARERGLDGQYVLRLQNFSNPPQLVHLHDRDVRQRLMAASLGRGARGNEFDNRDIVARTFRLRAERAALLGYDNHAHFVLEDQTARTVAAVNDLHGSLTPAAVANARREAEALQALINETEAEPFELAAWDWQYYAERLRQRRFDFDDEQIRPYFELDSVLVNGVFYAAERLYGLTFEERHDLPTYHPDVRVFEVFDRDGEPLALFLGDFYARSAKRGGAWMNSYAVQSELLGGRPVVGNHQNIPKPPAGEPTLMTLSEVTTMFHEFGHALHGLFSNVTYPRFAATAVPRDFVEYPAQVNEMWAVWPEVLANYARHHETGERLPQDLLERVLASQQFNEGFRTTEYLAASIIDQAWHQLTAEEIVDAEDVPAFEAEALAAAGIDFAPVPPRYRTPYFSHIMGGYASGYYAYIWSEVLDADSVAWFEDTGGLERANGDHFRATVLSRGGSVDAMTLYRSFASREPDIRHLLERRGLLGEP